MPKSESEIISPGQGLLLMIAHYKKNPEMCSELEKLYLSGVKDSSDKERMKEYFHDEALGGYQISYTPKSINDDPTRRYFETHLAYESLKNGLNNLDMAELKKHYQNLIDLLPESRADEWVEILNAKFDPDFDDDSYDEDTETIKQYTVYIQQIELKKIFKDFSSDNSEKIVLLVKCSFLGVLSAYFTDMPLDIYDTGFFEDARRGKVFVKGQETTRNQNWGLMKGHMPLPLDDIALAYRAPPLLKPSDQSTFVDHAEWPKMNFDKMVHPFSNSISGTTLAQLRSMAKLRADGQYTFSASSEKMAEYFKLFISAMLFGSGGHSIYEFASPLFLPETQKIFDSIPGFDKISLESMFLIGNETGFHEALKDAIRYNAMILQRKKLMDNTHLNYQAANLRKQSVENQNVDSKIPDASAKFKSSENLPFAQLNQSSGGNPISDSDFLRRLEQKIANYTQTTAPIQHDRHSVELLPDGDFEKQPNLIYFSTERDTNSHLLQKITFTILDDFSPLTVTIDPETWNIDVNQSDDALKTLLDVKLDKIRELFDPKLFHHKP